MTCPVWEHRYQDGAEFVRAAPGVKAIVAADADLNGKGYLCQSAFTLADGREVVGYCSPQDTSGMDYVQPTILIEGHHWDLWSEPCPIDLSSSGVFPLSMKCRVRTDEGFCTAVFESAPLRKEPNQPVETTPTAARSPRLT